MRRAPGACSASRTTDLVMLPNGFDPGRLPARRRPCDRGADLAATRSATECARRPDGPVIVYVGRFTEVKRIPLLLEAFARRPPRLQHARARWCSSAASPASGEGEHPAGRRRAARRPATRPPRRLASTHDELPEILAAARRRSCCPRCASSFGQVLVEAMACGLPAIAVDAPGPAEIVERRRDRLARRRGRPRLARRRPRRCREPAGRARAPRPQRAPRGARPLRLARDRRARRGRARRRRPARASATAARRLPRGRAPEMLAACPSATSRS